MPATDAPRGHLLGGTADRWKKMRMHSTSLVHAPSWMERVTEKVKAGPWDTHFDHFRLYDDNLMPELDQSLSALIENLSHRGLLEETILLVIGEFGRTPKINNAKDGGRDHWSKAYSVLFAGGGIRGGQIHGATDKHAAEVKDLPVKPNDLAATLYEALGMPHDMMLTDMKGRPHRITGGQPILSLFG